jgi:hypothetical protein
LSQPNKSPEHLRNGAGERQLKVYAKPQLIVYGPVAGLTGGMSNKMFPDNAGMTMMNA